MGGEEGSFRIIMDESLARLKGYLAPLGQAIVAQEPLSHRLERGLFGLWPRLSARFGLHLSIALVAVVIALARGSGLWEEKALFVPPAEASEDYELPVGFNVEPLETGGFLLRAPVPRTIIPPRPRETIIAYVIQSNDNLYGIAEKFGITADTIAWANGKLEEHPDLLKVGEELIIPPTSGVLHTVIANDTLESIAKKYKVSVSAITEYEINHLDDSAVLKVGQKIMVPGGNKPYVAPVVKPKPKVAQPVPVAAPVGKGRFIWPTSGRITQRYWSRHRAIDIGAKKGTPVYAADSGYVTFAGWSQVGYGYYMVIDHGNGFETLYAHLSWYAVEAGQSVKQGQFIGRVGSTGRSTGPHLHFEIIYNGVNRSPFAYLP